ncbi:hypothetical protein [Salipiger mucosus]|uniref:Uncharacterized protein n=1 Tax=Salipiger mucosus DSM 16094 TaxID=1123237 RepID=S9QYQ3_9RHOB|nr:hypothetical protein [Salipiger mucosus]EPX84778.1 hypothetical protein Salmuc_01351 [Salipiger mucosus DSM 16094]
MAAFQIPDSFYLQPRAESQDPETSGCADCKAAADRIETLEEALRNLVTAISWDWDLDGPLGVARTVLSTSEKDQAEQPFEERLRTTLDEGNCPTAVIAVLDLGLTVPVVAGIVVDASGEKREVQFHANGTYDVIGHGDKRIPFNRRTVTQIATLYQQAEDVWDEFAHLRGKSWSKMITPVRRAPH